jgi:MFS family permease
VAAVAEQCLEERAGVLDSERRALTLGLVLVVSTVAFEAISVATVLPVAVPDLGSIGLYGWSFSAFMLASLVAKIPAGDAADRRGVLLPLSAGIALFAAGLVAAGLAPSMLVFIGGRALQGFGAGAITSIAYVCIARGYPDALRPRMMALLSSAWVVPSLVGPALAGAAAERWTWRLVFLGLLPLPALAGAMIVPAVRRMPVGSSERAEPGRLRDAVLLAGGVALVLAALDLSQVWLVVPLAVAGAAVAWPPLVRLLPPGTLRLRRGVPAGLATYGLLNYCFFGAEAFVPLGLTSLRGMSVTAAGVSLTASSLSWTAGAWIQDRLDGRFAGGARRLRVQVGFGVLLAGVALMAATVLSGELPVATAWLAWTLAGLGIGLAYPTIGVVILKHAPPGRDGNLAASLGLAEALSVAVAAGIGGGAIALARTAGWSPATGLAAAFGLALLAGAVGLAVTGRMSGEDGAAVA